MHRILILVLAIAAAAVRADFEDFIKCERLLRPHNHHCCKGLTSMLEKVEGTKEDHKNCEKDHPPPNPEERHMGPPPPPSVVCEMEKCMAKKKGLLSSDDTIDKKALQEYLEKQFDSAPEIVDNLMEKCVKADINALMYAPKDACDPVKLHHCIRIQLIKECDDWDNTGECSGLKDLAEECGAKVP